jgi:hypothetical protein
MYNDNGTATLEIVAFPNTGNQTRLGRTNYVGVSGYLGNIPNYPPADVYTGVFANRTDHALATIEDGTSNTLFFGETIGGKDDSTAAPQYGHSWIGAGALPTGWGVQTRGWESFSSEHPNIVQFCLADGAVRKLNRHVDFMIYVRLSGMRDRRTVNMEDVQ